MKLFRVIKDQEKYYIQKRVENCAWGKRWSLCSLGRATLADAEARARELATHNNSKYIGFVENPEKGDSA